MSKNIITVIAIVAFVALASFDVASARRGPYKAETPERGENMKDTCPAMGGEVNKDTRCEAQIDVMKECKKAKMGSKCPMMN